MKRKIVKHISEIIPLGWKVDKMKLEIKYRTIEELQEVIFELTFDSRVVEQYESKQLQKCGKNYKIELPEGIVYIGVGKNSHQGNWKENQKIMILEYNPQKVNPFKEIRYLQHITTMDKLRIGVMSFDMAYDMYTHITKLEMDKRHGNEKYGEYGSNNPETFYRGEMGNNHIKLYNKAKELNKTIEDITEDGEIVQEKLKVTGDCTRFEITIKFPPDIRARMMHFEYWDLTGLIELPEIRPKADNDKVLNEILEIGGNDTIKLFAIHNGLERHITNKNTRKKYIEMYNEIKKKSLDCDSRDIIKILENFNMNKLNDTISQYIMSTFRGKKLVPETIE